MRILLDTNAYAALLEKDPFVARKVRQANKIFLSSVVLGELLAGFRHGSREDQNRRVLEEFLANPYTEIVAVTRATAEHFASIWSELRTRGRPIPANDMWIAAHARETGAELISFDRHFREVAGLLWTDPQTS